MSLRLFKQKMKVINKTLEKLLLAGCIAVTIGSCSQNNDVLITEIGVTPPKASSTRPNSATDFYLRGQQLQSQGDLPGALAAYNQAITLNSNYVDA
jgi:TPR repeat